MPTMRGSDTGSKKRYAGLTGNSDAEKLIFKGLETVRTDWSELAKQFQQALYKQIFHDQNPAALIRQTVDATLNGERDHQLIYRKRLRRPLRQYIKNVPPHVRAARLADLENTRLGKPLRYQNKGTIAYVMTVTGPEPVEYHGSPPDYQHYIDKQLKPVADAILPFVGLNFDELISVQLSLF
jgi:DNA polymerase-2